ncbi:MAG: hypothetical protein H6793_03315 [Candidatus Nomurabacteria bacterium]|nr:hypothetical protein [Candidatus Saccharibacteria bacterium]USN95336.1 MAG: hypothetical protein H6793_03315 [Candidatus Nomurabacteria bacterium]
MRNFEALDPIANKIIVVIDAKSDIQNLGKIASDIGKETRAFKLGLELMQFDRPWSIHRMLRDHDIETWLDTNYVLDSDQIPQVANSVFSRGVKKLSVSALSGHQSLISAVNATDHDSSIFIPMPNYHDDLIVPFLEEVIMANEYLPHRKQITDIMCNVGMIERVKNIGNFTVIATGIRYNNQPIDQHPTTMSPKEAIDHGADILAIGRLLTKYSNYEYNYKTTLEKVKTDIEQLF